MNARGLRGDQTPRTWTTAFSSFRCDITCLGTSDALGSLQRPRCRKAGSGFLTDWQESVRASANLLVALSMDRPVNLVGHASRVLTQGNEQAQLAAIRCHFGQRWRFSFDDLDVGTLRTITGTLSERRLDWDLLTCRVDIGIVQRRCALTPSGIVWRRSNAAAVGGTAAIILNSTDVSPIVDLTPSTSQHAGRRDYHQPVPTER